MITFFKSRSLYARNRTDTVLFSSTIDELCNVDTISSLQSLGGGFHAGAACGLGEFAAIGEAEIEVLRLKNQ